MVQKTVDLRLYLRYRIFYGGDILISFICSIIEDTDDQRFIIDPYHRYKKLMLMTGGKYVRMKMIVIVTIVISDAGKLG